MKSIKEKQLLVKWSKAMNEPIDADLLEEVERFNSLQNDVLESVRKNTISDLIEAQHVAEELVTKINLDYPKPPTLEELMGIVQEEVNELVQTQPKQISVTEETPTPAPQPAKTLAEKAAIHITNEVRLEEKADSFQQPNPKSVDKNFDAVQKKLKFLEQAIGKIAATGPGSGSYWLYDLGDTNYDIIKNPSNKDVLTYNTANTKWEVGNVGNLLNVRYYGSYFSNVNQSLSNVSLYKFVTLNNIDSQNGFTSDGANLIAQYTGVYNLQFSSQVHYEGGGGSGSTVEIWLAKNGLAVPDTNTRLNITSNNPFSVAAWNLVVSMNAGDKVALAWATDNLNIQFDVNSGRLGPNIPSVILTIVQV
jgi:hypothetical protein